MSQETKVLIRTAVGDDAQAVRMLLGMTADVWEHVVVAETGEPRRIIAAAGVTRSRRHKPPVGPAVTIHVVEPNRGQGIGRALLAELADKSATAGDAALYATHRVDLNSAEMQAWTALGFIPCETVEYHELPLDEFEPQLAPLYERMHQRGKIPPSARIVPLYDADIDQVARLHLSQLGGDPDTLAQKLRGEIQESFAPRYSRVLLVDDRVVGFILGHRVARDVVHVDANVIAPEIRGGWANVWLKLEATRGALAWGIKKFVFSTFDHYADTRSFTERLRGITVGTKVLMHLPLKPA